MKQPCVKIFLILVFLYSANSADVFAQYYHFGQYSLEEGLPQSEVTSIVEDHLGYIWVGTNGGGLCRFNGKSFDVYTRKNGLHDNIVIGLYLDNDFNIWIGSPESIIRYDGKTFKKIFVSDTTFFINQTKFYETSGGDLWVHSTLSDASRGFFKIVNDSLIDAKEFFPELGGDNSVLYVTKENSNRLIITTTKGLYELRSGKLTPSDFLPPDTTELKVPLLIDRGNNAWTLVFNLKEHSRKLQLYRSGKFVKDVSLPEGVSTYSLMDSYQDRAGGVWFSVFNFGVIRYINGIWEEFTEKNGLPINAVRSIHEDPEGNFWFGTLGAGLVRYSGDLFISFDSRSGLSDDIVRSIYQDSKGIYYFGVNGGGLNIYDGKKIRVVKLEENSGSGYISEMYEVRPGVLLLATYAGLYEFDGSGLRSCYKDYGLKRPYPVMDIAVKGDTLFFAVYNEGLVMSVNGKAVSFNAKNSDFKARLASSLFLDSKDNLWICSEKGVWLYNGGLVNINKKYNLRVNYILQVAEDKTGNIWFATYTDGLLKFDGDTFLVVDASSGLTSDNIYSVISDDDGNIWAGTQNGVDKLTMDNAGEIVSIENFGKYDGFVGIENNGKANFKDRYGNLWFGTIKGAIKYSPGKRHINYLPPPVYIKDVSVGFKQIDWNNAPDFVRFDSVSSWFNMPAGLILPHNRNHVSFAFDGLCYTVPEKVKYRWKLSPLEDEYTPPAKTNRAVYSSLPYGNYTLYVKACNSSGIWNDIPTEYSFVIKPAWWQTTLFKILLVLLSIGLFVFIYRTRRNSRQVFKKEMETLLGSKSAEIKEHKRELSEKEKQVRDMQKEREGLQKEIEKYRKNIGELAAIGDVTLSAASFEEIFMSVYRDVQNVMDVCLFGVGVINRENNTLEFQNLMINKERAAFLKFSLDDIERFTVYSCMNDKVIIAKDITEEYKKYVSVKKPLPGDIDPHSIIIVPLKAYNRVFGVVTVQSPKIGLYDDYHLNALKIIADFLTVFLDKIS